MSECIIWTGTKKNNGKGTWYGTVSVRIAPNVWRSRYAHRMAYEEAHGPIPSGQHVHHTCGTSLCVNPDHLAVLAPDDHAREHHPRREVCRAGLHDLSDPANVSPNGGARTCRACRQEAQRQWSKGARDAAYWREYRARKKAKTGAETFSDAQRIERGEKPLGNLRRLRERDERGRYR